MERTRVSSSNLHSIGYDPSSNILEIAFLSGGVYQYSGVNQDIYFGLMNAASHGKYFHAHIKDIYPFRKVG